jgi:hypothetical protein
MTSSTFCKSGGPLRAMVLGPAPGLNCPKTDNPKGCKKVAGGRSASAGSELCDVDLERSKQCAICQPEGLQESSRWSERQRRPPVANEKVVSTPKGCEKRRVWNRSFIRTREGSQHTSSDTPPGMQIVLANGFSGTPSGCESRPHFSSGSQANSQKRNPCFARLVSIGKIFGIAQRANFPEGYNPKGCKKVASGG